MSPRAIDVAQTYESGPLFDIGGSYMVYGDFGVGAELLAYVRRR